MTWGDVGTNMGGGDFLKLQPGGTVKLHILSEEPYSYWSVFFNGINRSANRTIEEMQTMDKDPDLKWRMQHAFHVYNMTEGKPQIWIVGNQTAEILKNCMASYNGSLAEIDIDLKRVGTGKDTKYTVIPKPTSFSEEVPALQPLEEIIKSTSDEDLDKLKNGEDPSAGLDPLAADTAAAAGKAAAQAPRPAPRPAPVQASVPGGGEKAALLRQIVQNWALPKFKDPKKKTALMAMVGKTKTLSQYSVDELRKLVALQKK